MIGLSNHERVDEALYEDYETAKSREVRAFLHHVFFVFDFIYMFLRSLYGALLVLCSSWFLVD